MKNAANDAADGVEATGPDWRRKTFSLPTSLADYIEKKAGRGSASAYIAGLIEADRHRETVRQELRDFGYVGPMEVTDEGRARARERLQRHAESRAARAQRRRAA